MGLQRNNQVIQTIFFEEEMKTAEWRRLELRKAPKKVRCQHQGARVVAHRPPYFETFALPSLTGGFPIVAIAE